VTLSLLVAVIKQFNILFRFIAHLAIPSQKDIQQSLLMRKKRELLQMYDLDDDMVEPEQSG